MPKTKNILSTQNTAFFSPPHAGRTIYTPSITRTSLQPSARPLSAYQLFCLTEARSKRDITLGYLRGKWALLDPREKGFYAETADKMWKEKLSKLTIRNGVGFPAEPDSACLVDLLVPRNTAVKLIESGNLRSTVNKSVPSDTEAYKDFQLLWTSKVDYDLLLELERAFLDFSGCEDFGDPESGIP